MSDMEKHEIADRVRAMDPEEQRIVAMCLSQEVFEQEMARREDAEVKRILLENKRNRMRMKSLYKAATV